MLVANEVPDVHGRQVACPYLRPDGRYVCFSGNGVRRGQGYLIIGKDSTGWLAKCGYLTGTVDQQKWAGKNGIGSAVRAFLGDLADLAELLGLIVVGIARRDEQWLSLKRLREIVDLPDTLAIMSEIHLRVYGTEDYLDRIRDVLAERAQFSIPGSDNKEISNEGPLLGDANLDLKVRLRRAGLSQRALADHLGVSASFLSQVLKGKKHWPEGLKRRAEDFVAGNGNGERKISILPTQPGLPGIAP